MARPRVSLPFGLLLFALGFPISCFAQDDHRVDSPDGALTLSVRLGEIPEFSVMWRGQPLVISSPFQLFLGEEGSPALVGEPVNVSREARDELLHPVVPEKRAEIRDHYNQLSLDFQGGWSVDLRVYDGGVAYRFRSSRDEDILIQGEKVHFRFPGDPDLWFPREDGFLTHQEREYEERTLSGIVQEEMASIPVLVAPEGLPKVLITEADLRSYPGFYLRGTGGDGLEAVFPAFPAVEEQTRDRTVRVVETEDFLARTSGARSFPWRLLVIAEEDKDLVESTLVYQLASPLELDDTSWIRPGKVAWDWWNASSLFGVDFKSGLNSETYLHFIDFAAEHGIEYIILDEGWSDPADLQKLNVDMDLPALLQRGREKGVGIILWVVWKTLDDELEAALDRFASWGVAGIKVDFMQRDDQPMVEYYWKVAEAAAQRHLLVDYHGAYKPTGLRRAFPNVITREGVMGLEHSKWSAQPTPEHNVTLPFIRMVAGPMDYTPGAMRNAQEEQFNPVFDRPMSLGTRVHQMAMYVAFESPLQMLSDSPSNYAREGECLAFISQVPTVWDETVVLSGEVGEWIAIARRSGEEWFIGAMSDWTPRELELDLSFLGSGSWEAELFQDGINANQNAEDYRRSVRAVDAARPLAIRLEAGGGWVARLRPGG
jgi:alpha-glucosidase